MTTAIYIGPRPSNQTIVCIYLYMVSLIASDHNYFYIHMLPYQFSCIAESVNDLCGKTTEENKRKQMIDNFYHHFQKLQKESMNPPLPNQNCHYFWPQDPIRTRVHPPKCLLRHIKKDQTFIKNYIRCYGTGTVNCGLCRYRLNTFLVINKTRRSLHSICV